MDVIDELMGEHREALQRLDGLDGLLAAPADSAAGMGADAAAGFARQWEWFRTELTLHFRKEEEALFAAAAPAVPVDAGPVAQMRAEHEELEGLRGEVAGALETLLHGCCARRDAAVRLRRAGGQFSSLLREHIWKEDHVLFPLLRVQMGREGIEEAGRLARGVVAPAAARG